MNPLPASSLRSSSLTGLTIAFDLDGTLVDTAPDLIGSLNQVLQEQKLPALSMQAARVMIGRGARALIQQGFAAAGEPLDAERLPALFDRFIVIYRGRIAAESRPFDGVVEALDALAEAGAKLVVCTNKYTDLSVALLDELDLTQRFAAVVGADSAPAPKPDPRHLWTAIEAAGGRRDRALMVGDSASDIGAARAADVPSVVVSFGYTEIAPADLGADHLIDHFAELVPLVTGLFASGV